MTYSTRSKTTAKAAFADARIMSATLLAVAFGPIAAICARPLMESAVVWLYGVFG